MLLASGAVSSWELVGSVAAPPEEMRAEAEEEEQEVWKFKLHFHFFQNSSSDC